MEAKPTGDLPDVEVVVDEQPLRLLECGAPDLFCRRSSEGSAELSFDTASVALSAAMSATAPPLAYESRL